MVRIYFFLFSLLASYTQYAYTKYRDMHPNSRLVRTQLLSALFPFPEGPDDGFVGGPEDGFPEGPDDGFAGGPDDGFAGGPDGGFPSWLFSAHIVSCKNFGPAFLFFMQRVAPAAHCVSGIKCMQSIQHSMPSLPALQLQYFSQSVLS